MAGKNSKCPTEAAVRIEALEPRLLFGVGAGDRQWWVYLSPQEAKALYASPAFGLIKNEADTYYANGIEWPRTGLDHASNWVNQEAQAQEVLAATYLGLKWGKYNGGSAPELVGYLNRMLYTWRQVITAGPTDLYSTSIPHYAGQFAAHSDPAGAFTPGWYEGDITLRNWLDGGYASYDAIRDDISVADRTTIDAWMRTMAGKLWKTNYGSDQNRGASSHGQAQEMALLLQDKPLFAGYFNDQKYGFFQAPGFFNFAPHPDGYFPQDAGLSLQIAFDDGPHGLNINRHVFQTLINITHAARHGGDAAWDVPVSYSDQKLLTNLLDNWYKMAGPLDKTFVTYMREVEASQNTNPQLSTTLQSLDGSLWEGYAMMDPRFLGVGYGYGNRNWIDDGRQGLSVLHMERARMIAGAADPFISTSDSVFNTQGHGVMEYPLTPQRGTFSADFDVTPGDTNVRSFVRLTRDRKATGSVGTEEIVFFLANGKIQATDSGVYKSVDAITLTAGVTYGFHVDVDVRSWTYNAKVTLSDGTVKTLASGYALSGAPSPVRYWDYEDNQSVNFKVRNFRISQPDTLHVAITSPQEEQQFRGGGTVTIQAAASSDGGAVSKVEFYQGLIKLGESTSAPFNFQWQNVAAGTYDLTARAYDSAGTAVDSSPVAVMVGATRSSLPQNWRHVEIGQTGMAGNSSESAGLFSISGSGSSIGGTSDGLQYAYQLLHGDGSIVAQVLSMNPTDTKARVGVMVRSSVAAGAQEAFVGMMRDGGAAFITRATAGATAGVVQAGSEKLAYWMKLVRSGNVFTALKSIDGTTWTAVGSPTTLVMGSDVLIGLATTAGNDNCLNNAMFGGVNTTGTITPQVAAASGLAATATSASGIHLSWNDNSTDETGFKIERSADGISFAPVATVGANVLSWDDNALTRGTTWTYRVRSYNALSDADPTNLDSAATWIDAANTAPSGLTALVLGSTQIALSWTDNATIETGYLIEQSSDGGGSFQTIATLGTDVAAYLVNGLKASTSYVYRVRAQAGGAISAPSNAATVVTSAPLTTPAAPSNLSLKVISDTQINLAWANPASNADGFQIQRSTDGVFFATLATQYGSLCSYADRHLLSNVNYTYRIRAFNAAGVSATSAKVTARTMVPPPTPASDLVTIPVSSTQVNLTWRDNSSNEDGFRVWRSDGSNLNNTGSIPYYTLVATLPAGTTSYSDKSVKADFSWAYRIQSFSSTLGDSGYSDIVRAYTPGPTAVPAAPSGLTATVISSSQINLAWANNAGTALEGFKLERSQDKVHWTQVSIRDKAAPNFNDTGLDSGASYTYRVRAYTSGGNVNSAYTAGVNATTSGNAAIPTQPDGLRVTYFSNTRLDLAWTDNSNAESGFVIERSGDGRTFSQVTAVGPNVTQYSDTPLMPDLTYTYRVAAYNVSGQSGYSNPAFETTLSKPAAPKLTALLPTADGSKQRSIITQSVVTFDHPVTLGAGALTLSGPAGNVALTIGNAGVLSASFTVSYSGGLSDGVYVMTMNGAAIQDEYGQALTDGTVTRSFHRLFGDINGDAYVDALDSRAFRLAMGSARGSSSYVSCFDVNGDGFIDALDSRAFRGQMGKSLLY